MVQGQSAAMIDADEYQMHGGNYFHREDGKAIPGVDSYAAAWKIFQEGWPGPILCVDIPRAKLVKTCAEANLFFFPPKKLSTWNRLAEWMMDRFIWGPRRRARP
jgi:hypothetical protein